MAKRHARRTSRSQEDSEYPGWVWGLCGLTIGLSVAAAVWVSDRAGEEISHPVARAAMNPGKTLDDNGEGAAIGGAQTKPVQGRFTFYDVLPNFEVVIPETDPEVAADTGPQAVEVSGTYVLQAGSFTSYDDADRRRAQLAMQGIESSIQRVSIDATTYHRVRIGPTNDLDELNMLRSRLRAARIEYLRIRLGD